MLGTYAPKWKMKPSDLLRVFDTEQISADMIYACGLSQHHRQERAFHGCAYAPLLQAHPLAMVCDDYSFRLFYVKNYREKAILR